VGIGAAAVGEKARLGMKRGPSTKKSEDYSSFFFSGFTVNQH